MRSYDYYYWNMALINFHTRPYVLTYFIYTMYFDSLTAGSPLAHVLNIIAHLLSPIHDLYIGDVKLFERSLI